MRILFVCDYFPPFAPGGAEWSIYYLTQALVKNKHKVCILTPNYGKLPFEQRKNGSKIIRYPFPFKLKSNERIVPYIFLNQFFYYIYSAFFIIKTSIKEKPDIIHVQSRFSLPGAVLAKLFLNIPLVFNVRNSMLFCPIGMCLHKKETLTRYADFSHFWRHCSSEYIKKYIRPKTKLFYLYTRLNLFYLWLDNFVKRKLLKFCDKVIFISYGLRDLYLKAGFILKEKSEVVYNLPPIDIEKPSRKKVELLRKAYGFKNKKVILYASRLTLGKGIYDLLEAAKIVINKNKRAVFLLLGKGKPEFFKHKRIKIIPPVFHQKLFAFYKLADLVVVPSRCVEGLGRIPQEAALFKKPVIVTNTGGLPEQIIDKKTGFIVPKGEPTKLAKAMLRLLNDDKLRRVMGKKHKIFIKKKFSEVKIVNKQISIYKSILK